MTEKYEKFLDWVVYQIYPRSFMDSNGDGIGDLRGITQKIDHLVELGVNAVWICPCYKSPNCDYGYDISDYRDIMSEFGNIEDWKELKEGLHAKGIKLIMDLVANHTSSEHPWFLSAKEDRNSPYHDYYIWRETPPNDWQSAFGGSAWEYNPKTKEYYLHSFAIGQPDLNWENEKVRKEIAAVVDYWIDMGVDGFRCDVLDYIAKDFALGKQKQGKEYHRYVKELFGRKKTENIFTVGECSTGQEDIAKICAEERGELTCIFQFDHFDIGRERDKFIAKPYTLDELKRVLVRWQNFMQTEDLLYTLFTDNHDHAHFISRLGKDKALRFECATAYAAAFYLLRGIPFIFQGQEYGSPDPYYENIEDFDDVETHNYYAAHKGEDKKSLMQKINFGSRDNTRRPYCWSNEKNFGFSQGNSTWIALHTRGAEVNLEADKRAEKSVFRFYQELLKFRRESKAIRRGAFEDVTKGEGYFAYIRKKDEEEILVVCNFETPTEIRGLPSWEYAFGNGDVRETNGNYAPFETAIFRR